MTALPPPIIVWFRRDLRLADNPALSAAAASNRPIIPVYIHDTEAAGTWKDGEAVRWWLYHSLKALGDTLEGLGVRLLLLAGPTDVVLGQLSSVTKANLVVWNRRVEPWAIKHENTISIILNESGVETKSFNGSHLFDPGTITTNAGSPFKVFTPFWRACMSGMAPPKPLKAPTSLIPYAEMPDGESLVTWRLLPTKPDWSGGLQQFWVPGEAAAMDRLSDFLDNSIEQYAVGRDHPGQDLTSRLSPHLAFGEISAAQVFHAAIGAAPSSGNDRFLAEIGWREFSGHLLHRYPDLPGRSLRPEFERMAWHSDPVALKAWQRGQTGYPIVDAGMRQLWAIGWMHNRVRMVVASFLIKHLLISWREGAAWFWDTLVDADLASNSASWQWVAGCGADATPFFRIFNPVLQGEKFDTNGKYVRQWCPELAKLPDRWIHQPWKAPSEIMHSAGVEFGKSYPCPLVNHNVARRRALDAFTQLR